jgi:sugar lactone lactonase YvrE
VTLDPIGNLFITDRSNLRVRRVDTNQIITTVAGNGLEGFAGDGGPATEAKLHEPGGLAANAAGHLFLADFGNYCVRKVIPDGLITTVAGRGSDTPYDGIVATNAQLDNPSSATLYAAGNLVFSDYNTIRRLSTNGLLTRIAGTGYTGYSGDGGAATLAMLYSPSGVAVDTVGNVFIADTGNQRIRRVDTNSVITTVAGKGTYGYSGDGGAATNAQFYNPGGLAVNAAGGLFIADSANHRIRKMDARGVITTVAGNGTNGYAGDGGSAIQAKISMPAGLALDASGNLFIADYGNHRIRQVSPFASLPTLTLNNVTTNHAGDYRVIVTGPSGSVTSSVATLTVVMELPALSLTRNGTNFRLSFLTETGASYQLESAANLPAATWLNEGPPFPGTGGVLSTNIPLGTEPRKFFRLQLSN